MNFKFPTQNEYENDIICFPLSIFKKKKEKEKLAEIINKANEHVYHQSDTIHEIFIISTDKSDFVVKMFEDVDNFIKNFVENDDFLKKVPEGADESLKRELKPFFEEEYVLALT